ncbi:MAG: calcium/sodium antiporter [Saccharofermentans sp.]|nr:calcium/sodium antiporter [Saccharofermentans sp.]
MTIAIQVCLLFISFVLLIKGADIFVDGSASLAKSLNVPSLIIGLTIVAFGTSAPELAVSTTAAIQGSNEIAVSNVIGSNIFNLLVVLGSCALFNSIPVESKVLKRDIPFSILITAFLLVASYKSDMIITRVIGIILLVLFVSYLGVLIYSSRHSDEQTEEGNSDNPLWKSILFIVLGAAMIIIGGRFAVSSAKAIALAAGMSETLVGLTIIATGTSLPELITSIVAARKGEVSLAIGNAVGSNIFNVLLILGVSSLIRSIQLTNESLLDMIALIGISVMTLVFAVSGKKINRVEGAVMLFAYVAYVVFAATR